MTPQGEKSYLKTTKKGNVTINPRKEDLMSESLRRRIQSNLSDLKEAAKKKDKEKKVKRWWDDDGDGVGYEPHEVKKEETCNTASIKPAKKPMGKGAVDATPEKNEDYDVDTANQLWSEVAERLEKLGEMDGAKFKVIGEKMSCDDDNEDETKNSIKDRMKQKMLQATAEKDKQRSGMMPS